MGGTTTNQQVYGSLQNTGTENHMCMDLPPALVNIQILDCRTGLPMKDLVVNSLKIGSGANDVYVKDGQATNGLLYCMGKTVGGVVMNGVEDQKKKVLKTNVNGIVSIPISIDRFNQDLEIKLGLKDYAILGETFKSGKSNDGLFRSLPSGPTRLKFTYKNAKYVQPDPAKDHNSETSWGWSASATSSGPTTADGLWLEELMQKSVLKGNPPATNLPYDFKLVETFKVPRYDFGKVHPDVYTYDITKTTKPPPYTLKQMEDVHDWIKNNFNAYATGFGFGTNSFSKMNHFVVFALTWVKGIDIYDGTFSYLQTDAQWDAVKKYGIEFVQIKMTDGFSSQAHTADHAAKARARGMKVGYYHWPHPELLLPKFDKNGKVQYSGGKPVLSTTTRTGTAEAEYVLKVLATMPQPDMPLMIDLETLIGSDTGTTAQQQDDNAAWVSEFLGVIKAKWPWPNSYKPTLIYGYPSYMNARLPATDTHGLSQYPLDIAFYPFDFPEKKSNPKEKPKWDKIKIEGKLAPMIPGWMNAGKFANSIPPPWKMYTIWQGSGQGHIPGIYDSNKYGMQFDKDYCIDTSPLW